VHGGGIEPGTSELCLAIAGYDPADLTPSGPVYDYWMLEGIRTSGNAALHVTATHCDDPVALATAAASRRTVSLHGCSPAEAELDDDVAAVLVGGLDTDLKAALIQAYRAAGVNAIDASTVPPLSGTDTRNIVNLNGRGKGVQLELTTPLRTDMFFTNTRKDRKNTLKPLFDTFVNATRSALA
jgi:phage replication-related protein YjqB (UPF0714/DUF867 family)